MQCIRWERAPARGSLWLLPPGPDQVRNSASPEPIECTSREEVYRMWYRKGKQLPIRYISSMRCAFCLLEKPPCRYHALQGIVQDAVLACEVEADIAPFRMLEEVGGRNACHADPACKFEREAGV